MSTKLTFSAISTTDHTTIVFSDGQSATIKSDHPYFDELKQAMANKDGRLVYDLCFPSEQFKKQLNEKLGNVSDVDLTTRVSIEHGVITFDGIAISNYLCDRMLAMVEDGFDVLPMANFLENLMENPSRTAVQELYSFLENSDLPITEDGHFLAYKRINGEYKDIYTGRMDNSVGVTVEMMHNEVDDNRDNTCSFGLHFCARSYLTHYGTSAGNRTVIVKINPADVVSIPSDYNNAKGRTCKYVVVGELTHGNEQPLEGLVSKIPDAAVVGNTGKEVIQINPENGLALRTYSSPTAAATATNIDSSSISKVCNGKRNTAGGFKWAWSKPINKS